MKPIFGEYDCKIDSKGRFLLPSGLKKQLPENEQEEFVVNRGIDQCLVLYPLSVWERELQTIYSKNQFVAKNRAFARKFLNGATRITLDGNSRVLLPKRLNDHARISKDIVLVAAFDRVEIWDSAVYEAWLADDRYDLEKLSEEVMGDEDQRGGEGIS
ncbi:MAG: division/cell wall cluster transcriptional repressor MraZ [Bacteroidia bacterium]|nr:division/cell wall cluster transcriptional repressor MraZ [Bacteroidia bacterium]